LKIRIAFLVFASLLILACNQSPFEQGRVLYENYCSSCHMSDGSGLKTIYPALKDNPILLNDEANVPCLIRNGHKGNLLSADMPAYPKMTEVQISNIMNFINHTINKKEVISFTWVKEKLRILKIYLKPQIYPSRSEVIRNSILIIDNGFYPSIRGFICNIHEVEHFQAEPDIF